MKKLITYLFFLIFIFLVFLIFILSTKGIETKKFNTFVTQKATQSKEIDLKLNTIKFKLDPKQLSLFLETKNPEINYKNIIIPVQNIKVYIDFPSLLKSKTKINKTTLKLKELDINELVKLSSIIKPSNFKSFINNKITSGKLISEIEIFFDEKGYIKNFIARGIVKNLEAQIISGLNINKTNLSFFADKEDILLKNINGNIDEIQISDGDLKLNLEKGTKLNSNFKSKINYKQDPSSKFTKILDKFYFANKVKSLNGEFNNNLSINFDETYKVKDYNYNLSGNFEKSKLEFRSIKNSFFSEEIKEIFLSNFKIQTSLSSKKIKISGEGKYSFDNNDFLKVKFENNLINELLKLKLDFEYINRFKIDLINYKKPKNQIANISLELDKKKDKININKLRFSERNNLIQLEDLKFMKNQFLSFKKIIIKTINNEFSISNNEKIFIKGSRFDATNLIKFLTNKKEENRLKNISNSVVIDFKNIKVPMSESLQDFKLIGEIKKGKFVKISSKGDFGGNNFLDISMKKDEINNTKYLEIYSDLTRPLLTDYSFFKGLSGGKLLYTSIIDGSKSNSKLKIEDFRVINAPGVVKLLSLADLGGLADLAEGEGLTFDILEIDMEKNKGMLKLNEILVLGPSMSVLMDGYQDDNGLTSLRGTLVPAKTLNKLISKIPVLGNIIIPKEIGEGLFGVSFKMKGTKGKIKTTINPIKTLTPRFIQKIIDKNKATK
tara:strand:- start:3511 stop:5679 length:2169 start_codon:yes stop_codon:yes gene_type:complete